MPNNTDPQPSCSESYWIKLLVAIPCGYYDHRTGVALSNAYKAITEALQAKQADITKWKLRAEAYEKTCESLRAEVENGRKLHRQALDSMAEVHHEEISRIKAEVERLSEVNKRLELHKQCEKSVQRDMAERQNLLEAKLSRFKKILKGRDGALEKIRHCHGMTEDCAKKVGWIIDQALSKTWEEGE